MARPHSIGIYGKAKPTDFSAVAALTGQVAPGNIDLNHRPVVKNKDGSISTVRSISVGTGQGETLIPTVVGHAVVSDADAIKHFQQTGENLGTFMSVDAANRRAISLHDQQAAQYLPPKPQRKPKTPAADPIVGYDPGLGVSVTRSGKSVDAHGKQTTAVITPRDIGHAANVAGSVVVGEPFSETQLGKLVQGRKSPLDLVTDPFKPVKDGQVNAQMPPIGPFKAGGIFGKAGGALPRDAQKLLEESKAVPAAPPKPGAEVGASLAQARKLRREQEKLYSQERAKRITEAERMMNEVGGEEGHRLALKALSGDLPKLEFTAGKELSRDTLPDLFQHIQEHPGLRPYERVSTRNALLRILDGKVPTKSEIRLLGTAFGEDDAAKLAGSVGLWKKLGNVGLQLLNVPRALKSSFDLSAPFRQGLVLGARHPKVFASEFKPMLKSFASEGAYKNVMDDIASRPTFKLMQDSKLALTDLENVASREEAFASNIAEVVPGVRASGRGYVAFLNKFRADAFDNYLKIAEAQGADITNPEVTASIARWVNYATGRGGQSKFVANHAVGLNATFFSPRLIASRLNLLANPKFYADLDPFARKQALQGMGQLLGGVSLTLWLAKMAGADVGVDPRSSDFGKIKVGDTRVDILGGFQQYIVFAARMYTGETVSSSTGKVEHLTGGFGKASRGTLAARLAQQKLAPIPGFAVGWANNENFAGQPFNPAKEAPQLLAPLGPLNAVQTYQQEGTGPALAGLGLGSIGFGVQTYGSPPPKKRKGSGGGGGLGVYGGSSGSSSSGGLGVYGP